ncbi:MAG: diacylglycerol kinase family protein [Acidobacteriota bacterium]
MSNLLVYNPNAGGGRAGALVPRLQSLYEEAGEVVEIAPTERPGHAVELVGAALERDTPPTDIVALGGDGTLNECLWGADRVGALESSAAPRFTVLPAGTVNVLARELGLPLEPVAALRQVLPGATRLLDWYRATSSAGSRPGALGCGVGLEAVAAEEVSPRLKRWLGAPAYALSALKVLWRPQPMLSLRWVDQDGESGEREAPAACFANTTRYAGNFRLRRDAAIDDGLVELAAFARVSIPTLVSAGWHAAFSELARAGGVEVEAVRELEVSSEVPVSLHVDAELHGTTPLRVEVHRQGLSMRVGAPTHG